MTDGALDPNPARPGATGSRWAIAAVGAAAVLATGLVWWATGPWGPGLSPDAIAYVSIAERLRDHGQIGYWLEPQTSSWPPLFPAVLAGLSALSGASVIDTARAFNAVAAGAIVIVVALLAWRLLTQPWLRGLAVALAVLAQPLVSVAIKAWSEPLFNLFVLGTLLVLAGVPGRRPTLRLLAASALAVGAFTTRYAGFAVVPTGIVVLALWPRDQPRRTRLTQGAWFGGPAIVAAGALVTWNRWRTGQAFGPRWRPHDPFWKHAADGLSAIGQWMLPAASPRGLTLVFGTIVFVAAAVAPVAAWPRRGDGSPEGPSPATIGVAPVLAVFVGGYFAYMVYARTTSGFDPLNSRLMMPILVPGVLLVLAAVERLAATRPRDLSRTLVLALPLIVVAPLLSDGLDTLRTSHDVGNEYTNAAVRAFVASPVLQQVPGDCDLVTNDPWLLWLAGFQAQLSPESDRRLAIPPSMQLDDLPAQAAQHPVCLVWLETGSTVFYPPDQLGHAVDLQRVAGDDFTTIYRVSPRG